MEVHISSTTLACMVFETVVAFAVPLGFLFIWKIKTRNSIVPLIVGCGVFIVFALILEKACHALVLGLDTPLADAVNGSTFLYVLYGVLAAGVFEEVGRYIGFKLVLHKYSDKGDAIMYGIGHGGTEAILLVGISSFMYLVLAATMNSEGIEAFLANYAGNNANAMRDVMTGIAEANPADYLYAGIERVAAFVLQIALSVFVFISAQDKKRRFLLPVAIGCHMAANVAPALYQRGVIESLPLTEGIVIAAAAITAGVAYKLYMHYGEKVRNKK